VKTIKYIQQKYNIESIIANALEFVLEIAIHVYLISEYMRM